MIHAVLVPLCAPRVVALVSLSLTVLLAASPAPAQTESSALLERRVKAAFLFKFVDFVEWPQSAYASPDAPLTIGMMGDDGVAAELAQIVAGRPLDRRALVVKRLNDGDPTEGLQMLFIGRNTGRTLAAMKAATRPVLVVTEAPGALNRGSTINFVMHDGRLRFEVALDEAEKRGLKLSSRLITVAQNVRAGSQP